MMGTFKLHGVGPRTAALRRKYRAEAAHAYGRPHQASDCALCKISTEVEVAAFCEANAAIFSVRENAPGGFAAVARRTQKGHEQYFGRAR